MDNDSSASDTIKTSEIYKEQYAHFRSLNDILYKIPPLFSVAIGGVWYFAATQLRSEKILSIGLFFFAFVLCVCGVNIFYRFGKAINKYIDNLNKLDGIYAVSIRSSNSISTVTTIQILLWFAALMSASGAGYALFL